MSRVAATVVVTAAFLLAMAGVGQAATISARGSVFTIQGQFGFSAVQNCDISGSTRPIIVGTMAGARVWTKGGVLLSECSDQPPASPLGFDTESGQAIGTFGPAAPGGRNGQFGNLQWTFFDGSPDSVQFTLTDPSTNTVVIQASQQAPGAFLGSPGGVWTFGF